MRQSEPYYSAQARVVDLSYFLQHDLSLSYCATLPSSVHSTRFNPLVHPYRLSICLSTRRLREDPALSLVILLFGCPGLLASVTAIVHRSLVDHPSIAPMNNYTHARSIGKLVDPGPSPAIPNFSHDMPRHLFSRFHAGRRATSSHEGTHRVQSTGQHSLTSTLKPAVAENSVVARGVGPVGHISHCTGVPSLEWKCMNIELDAGSQHGPQD
ncbi:hypothetical protein BC629DRAFT_1599076 [Irpex lacteus]|nr:hypothetical protein BC629DRAFT_1599076 [Irpex lacteus]